MQGVNLPGKSDKLSCQSPAHERNRNKAKEVEKVPADSRSHRFFFFRCIVIENEREQLLSRF